MNAMRSLLLLASLSSRRSFAFSASTTAGSRTVARSSAKVSMSRSSVHPTAPPTKDLWILRHGQARHNPRAEAARDTGCSHEEFLELMRQDDCLDAPLTRLGRHQAQQASQAFRRAMQTTGTTPLAVVSSPLSRALQTAELVLGYPTFVPDDGADYDDNTLSAIDATHPISPLSLQPPPRLVCYEDFREINGWLLNGQRQCKRELHRRFPLWNLDAVPTEDDTTWDANQLETKDACGQRGRAGLVWVATHCPEPSVLIVAHGAILNAVLESNESMSTIQVHVKDGRSNDNTTSRSVHERYGNCELRRYQMQCTMDQSSDSSHTNERSYQIVLTEIDWNHDARNDCMELPRASNGSLS